MSIKTQNAALIVVDVQNGFMPKGHLAVKNSDKILPYVNQLMKYFDRIILTQDWHPANHISFFNHHDQKQAFDNIELDYGTQVLWPSHCVQGTSDADFHPDLDISLAQLIIRKGFHQHIDSYSAFVEADRTTKTGLAGYLKECGIDTVYVVGVATDFCVAWTAIDAINLGFKTYVIEDATAAIDLNNSLAQKWQEMQDLGIGRIQTADVLKS